MLHLYSDRLVFILNLFFEKKSMMGFKASYRIRKKYICSEDETDGGCAWLRWEHKPEELVLLLVPKLPQEHWRGQGSTAGCQVSHCVIGSFCSAHSICPTHSLALQGFGMRSTVREPRLFCYLPQEHLTAYFTCVWSHLWSFAFHESGLERDKTAQDKGLSATN